LFVHSVRIGRDKVVRLRRDAKPYALFCRAVLEDLIDAPPDVVHAHDGTPPFLSHSRRARVSFAKAATVFTIHNLAYQGRTSADVSKWSVFRDHGMPIEDKGEANLMARAITTTDIVSTVSESTRRKSHAEFASASRGSFVNDEPISGASPMGSTQSLRSLHTI